MQAFRASLLMTFLFAAFAGVAFPLLTWSVAQIMFPFQANGSLMKNAHGTIIGSSLIGQTFSRPEYFHPRPSSAGSGYDGANSSGSNLGPTNEILLRQFRESADRYRSENRLAKDAPLPADAVTRSASGLDPDISLQNALLQARRIAQARNIEVEQVTAQIARLVQGRFLGIWGEPRINVLEINLALDASRSQP